MVFEKLPQRASDPAPTTPGEPSSSARHGAAIFWSRPSRVHWVHLPSLGGPPSHRRPGCPAGPAKNAGPRSPMGERPYECDKVTKIPGVWPGFLRAPPRTPDPNRAIARPRRVAKTRALHSTTCPSCPGFARARDLRINPLRSPQWGRRTNGNPNSSSRRTRGLSGPSHR